MPCDVCAQRRLSASRHHGPKRVHRRRLRAPLLWSACLQRAAVLSGAPHRRRFCSVAHLYSHWAAVYGRYGCHAGPAAASTGAPSQCANQGTSDVIPSCRSGQAVVWPSSATAHSTPSVQLCKRLSLQRQLQHACMCFTLPRPGFIALSGMGAVASRCAAFFAYNTQVSSCALEVTCSLAHTQ